MGVRLCFMFDRCKMYWVEEEVRWDRNEMEWLSRAGELGKAQDVNKV